MPVVEKHSIGVCVSVMNSRLTKSSSRTPVARSRLRWGARASPALTVSPTATAGYQKPSCSLRSQMNRSSSVHATGSGAGSGSGGGGGGGSGRAIHY